MFVKLNKSIILSLLALFLLIIIPISFAADNSTAVLSEETANETQLISVPLDEDVLEASNDYYFDASVENDGDGSLANPYKYLTADRIKANSNLYLANGKYLLDASKSIQEVKIIGSDVDRTIIEYDGVAFTVNNQLTVSNVTLRNLSITNYAKFNATNVVFEDGYGSRPDSYGNNYGGAIFTDVKYATAKSYVSVDNCTFKNNYAIYGGAIYMGIGNLKVSDCLFLDNIAYNYGGAIACEYMGNVSVSKSRFHNSRSLNDAGGSIYVRASSRFAADSVDIVNSSSTFGGALTTLNTSTSLNHVNMINNSAKYDGGAVFHMYGDFLAFYSNFNNNSARNGGAIFIDNSTDAKFRSDTFTNNRATGTGGAIYSLLSKLSSQIKRFNTFTSNEAANENDCYDVSKLNLTIGNGNYTMYGIDVDPIDILPVRYSLIEDGYTTPVKDQESSGNCWAFTALSVLESCILKATGERLDLSEENMKNIMALYSDYGWNIDTNEGGYDFMHWGYLAGWLGPVDEMSDLFDDKSALSPILNSIMHIQNIKFLKRDSYTDNDEIKRAILNYGAVGTGMYFDSYYFSSGTDSYYCWYTTSGNHAVTIVGWDDAYSRSNFKYGSSIEGDGAWIVRNSWGSEWGDDGYFYVSYYDANFARPNTENIAYTIVLNDTIRFDRNYQYDIAGITDYFINSSSKVWYKNKFIAASDEYLAAVSTYFEKASNWTASVFVNGEMKDILSGISTAGYYTFNLNRFIPLRAGDVFEVIFNITTSGEAGIPISEIFHLNKLVYLPEMSYMSYDGENWVDLYDLTWEYSYHTYYSAVASIKAFTFLNPINTFTDLAVDFTQDGPSNVTASVRDEYANPVKYGNLTFNVNGENQTVAVVDGKAILLYNFNKRVNSISASFDGVGYSSSFNETTFTLPKLKIAWALNVTQFINNVNITVSADEPLNESVVMNVHGENIPFELVNGTNTLMLTDLPNDIYAVNVLLSEDSDYLADVLSDEFVIDIHHTRIASGNLTADGRSMISYNVTLLDEADNPIADREIDFIVANATYANMTDGDGVAVIFMQLDRGVHDVIALFKGDNSYFPSNASSVINVVISKLNATITVPDSLQVSVGGTAEVGASSNSDGALSYVVSDESVAGISNEGVLTGLKAGATSLTVSVAETDEYNANSVTIQVNVNKRDTNISLSYNDGAKELVATLTNADGKALNSANVIVALDGANYALKTNSKGQVKLSTADLPSGSYTAAVSYKGNSKYKPSNASATLIVNSRRDTDISVVYKSASNELVATLTNDEDKGLVTANVVVCLNGVDYALKTNSKGQARLSTVNLASGYYNVTVSYKGNSKYNPSSTTAEIFVKKTAVLSAPDVCVVYQDESGEFVATLTNDEGKALTSANVVVSLNGVEYSLKTNSKGQVKLSTASLTPGNYTAEVSYNGNSKYNPASATAEIVVNKKATYLSAVYNAESNELVATLTNGDGKALNSANVIVTLDGVDYALKTNSKGQVRVSTANLTAGTYTAEVSYRGNSKYAPASESVRIVVE